MTNFCRRKFAAVNRVHKKGIGTLSWKGNILENSLKFIQKNVEFVRIHGPTADEISKDLNLENKTCLITGANSGIGLEVTKCLSSRGCNVLMACRNTYAANLVMKNIKCERNNQISVFEINLNSLSSVKKCSENIRKQHNKIDIVILNAAVFGIPWTLTEDCLETTFQVNYLSQYYLLMSIEKILAPDARVVFTSSESHRNINWNMNKILSPTLEQLSIPKHEYTSIKAYNVSKVCCLLAMHYLGYRWLNSGKTVFCANPGSFIKTGLCRNWWVYEALYTSMLPFSKTIRQAASTIIYCATSPELNKLSALYFNDCRRCDESDIARDTHLSFRVNDLTRDLLRERIPDFNDTFRTIEYRDNVNSEEQVKEIIAHNHSSLISN
ncbi:unnamed protein product [Parnassius mnemosyne]|uniref:WW domain-containing oxidoreductase n=1 Tax=Parnassius mnemosyne TaxID=213953 RepID=A0AAV1M9K3_9NEOP